MILPGNAVMQPFSFSVYNKDLTQVILTSDGIGRDFRNPVVSFYSWMRGLRLPSVGEYAHPLYICHRSSVYADLVGGTNAQQIGEVLARVFCCFTQGVVLGWQTITPNVRIHSGVHEEFRHELLLDEHTTTTPLGQIVDALEVDDAFIRGHARTDVLKFALDMYTRYGSLHSWSEEEFVASGYSKFPYDQQLLRGVIGDLRMEHMFGGVTTLAKNALCPDVDRNDLADEIRLSLAAHLKKLSAYGSQQEYCDAECWPADSEEGGPFQVQILDKSVQIQGNVVASAVGDRNRLSINSITVYEQRLQNSDLGSQVKKALIASMNELKKLSLKPTEAEDVVDDLGKITDELESRTPQPGRLKRLWGHISEIAPTVASILKSIDLLS
jgi:hypothetical protein